MGDLERFSKIQSQINSVLKLKLDIKQKSKRIKNQILTCLCSFKCPLKMKEQG